MSTHNVGFYEDLTKIVFQLSSNMHLSSSSGFVKYTGDSDDLDFPIFYFSAIEVSL